MGVFSKFEGHVEDTFEGAANKMFDSPISPVEIAKKAEKQMRREKMVGAGKQYAPTLYTVLVNENDDRRLFGYYPTLAGETETYLAAKAVENGLAMDGQPLVRFITDKGLKHGKFEVIAELVAAPIIEQLRDEEMERYGIGGSVAPRGGGQQPAPRQQRQTPAANRQAAPYQAQQDDYGYDGYDDYGGYGGYEDYGTNDANAGQYAPYGQSPPRPSQPLPQQPSVSPMGNFDYLPSERGQAFDGFGQGGVLPNSAPALPEIYEPSPAGSQPAAVQRVSTPLPEIWGEGAGGLSGAAGSLESISAGNIAASAGAADMAGAAGIASSFGAAGGIGAASMAGAAGRIGVAGVAGAGAAGAANAVHAAGVSLNSLSSLDIPDPLTRRTSEPLPDPSVGIGSFAQDAAERAQVPASIPNTVMFAAGQGNAHPLP
ncbi:MAG: DUF3662 domain-containing protein, partial [Eggerthellaceae bacterium]|nr:DUF3662 domain-containing protein [Eggerthellaceae bacterium]